MAGIFFLVTTVFPKNAGLALTLPDEVRDVSPRNVLVLEVDRHGFVRVRMGQSARTTTITAREVGRTWRAEVARNPSLIAAVRVDPDAGYGRMIGVLDQLQLAGARRISLQAGER